MGTMRAVLKIQRDFMADWLVTQATNPMALFVGLVLLSFLLEDLATLTGAAIAADNPALFPVAITAVLFGIVVGDLGLYGLGAAARNRPKLRHWLERRGLHRAQRFMQENLFKLVLVSRLTPGLRLPCYAACGLLAADFRRFALYAVGLVAIWTVLLFVLTAKVGQFASQYLAVKDSWWVAVPLVLFVLWLGHRYMRRRMGLTADDDANN